MEYRIKDKYLAHFGIPGMKWGIRRNRTTSSIGGSGEHHDTSANSPDHESVSKIKKKKLSEMTNAELKEYSTRIKLEKEYKDLTAKQKTAGRAALEKVVLDAGTQVATEYAKKAMTYGVEQLLKSAMK